MDSVEGCPRRHFFLPRLFCGKQSHLIPRSFSFCSSEQKVQSCVVMDLICTLPRAMLQRQLLHFSHSIPSAVFHHLFTAGKYNWLIRVLPGKRVLWSTAQAPDLIKGECKHFKMNFNMMTQFYVDCSHVSSQIHVLLLVGLEPKILSVCKLFNKITFMTISFTFQMVYLHLVFYRQFCGCSKDSCFSVCSPWTRTTTQNIFLHPPDLAQHGLLLSICAL